MKSNFNFYQTNSSSAMLIVHGRKIQKGIRKKTLSQKIEMGINTLVFTTITLICVISLLYLAHANKVATKGYQLKNLKEERNLLMTENEIWNMKIARSQAIDTLKKDPLIAKMKTAGELKYIRTDTAVAKK